MASAALAWQQDSFEISGAVRDDAGHPVADASVRVQGRGDARAQEHTTDSAGTFAFRGLKAGAYVVSASRLGENSAEVSATGASGEIRHVELTLVKPPAGGKAAEMEFSDVPNFTIAAVTDWTAAGGHGSDTSLRASESLTRETLNLKPAPQNSAPSETDAKAKEQQLREALKRSPRDLAANQQLGHFYLSEERYAEAAAPLKTAYELDPANERNEYELALALARSGEPANAQAHLARMLAKGNRPEWQLLAGETDESLGDPLGAVRAYEQAVKQDPSEENYFAWGTELLQHRAVWQAREVFEVGVKAHPNSSRLLTALGTALFSGALYEEAAKRLCEASDLNPHDQEPYLFMGKVETVAPDRLPCVEAKLERFVTLQPTNALANYYYAMAYWKQHGKRSDAEIVSHVQTYLANAIKADPKCSSAYLQLGVIRASQSAYRDAADFYAKAIEADPHSSEAHYRLGVAYDRLGEKDKAAQEFTVHDELERQQAAAVDRQRREVKQFLVSVGGNQHDKDAEP